MIEPLPPGLTPQAARTLFRIYRSPFVSERTRLRARDLIWVRSMRLAAKQIHRTSSVSAPVRRHADDLFMDCLARLPAVVGGFDPGRDVGYVTYCWQSFRNCISQRLPWYMSIVPPPEGKQRQASVGVENWDAAAEPDHVRKADDRDEVGKLCRVLPSRDLRVIRLLYGLGGQGGHTKTEVASIEGVSREYVGQLESRALERMAAAPAPRLRPRTCYTAGGSEKRRYATAVAAKRAMKQFERYARASEDNEGLDSLKGAVVYLCPACGFYHSGHVRQPTGVGA